MEVDFTCTPGVYDDPKLDSVIKTVSAFNLELPVRFNCSKVYRDDKPAWKLSIDAKYRNQLAQFGVNYNVQAFVKVTVVEGGDVTMQPDTSFQSCVDKAKYIHLGDTLDITANDPSSVFLLPYSDWQNDSIRFVWL